MITVVWDETLETVPADSKIEDWAIDTLKEYNELKENACLTVRVGCSTQLNRLRLAVKREDISPKDMQIIFRKNLIRIDKHGTLDFYPDGFDCLIENQYLELAGWK